VELRRGDPDFDGAVVSLGALGVTTRVTLDVEPAFEVAQTVYPALDWDSLCEHFDEITSAGYSVSIFTGWGESGGTVWVKSRQPGDQPAAELFGAVASSRELHPLPGLDPVNCTAQLGVPGPWADRLPHFRMGFTPSSGAEIQSEYHLPRAFAVPAIRALRGLATELEAVLQISEIRTVRRDDLWLSPQHGRDTVSLHFTWVRDQPAVEVAVAAVEAALEPFGPRPHWGKLFRRGAHGAGSYDRLPDFLELRERWDPDGKFTNDWLVDHVIRAMPAASRD